MAKAYPGLDLNFDIPSDEETEESFSADCSGEPYTLGDARSPSSPPAPSSDVWSPSHSFACFFFFFVGLRTRDTCSAVLNEYPIFFISSLFFLSYQFELLGFWVVASSKLSCLALGH